METQAEFDPAKLRDSWTATLGKVENMKAEPVGGSSVSSDSSRENGEPFSVSEPDPEMVALLSDLTKAFFDTLYTSMGADELSPREVKAIAKPGALVLEKHAGRVTPEGMCGLAIAASAAVRMPTMVATYREKKQGKIDKPGKAGVGEQSATVEDDF